MTFLALDVFFSLRGLTGEADMEDEEEEEEKDEAPLPAMSDQKSSVGDVLAFTGSFVWAVAASIGADVDCDGDAGAGFLDNAGQVLDDGQGFGGREPAYNLSCATSYNLKWHLVSVNFISLVTSCVGFGRRSHKQPIPCPLHGRLI